MIRSLTAAILLAAVALAPAAALVWLRAGTGEELDAATARTITDERRVTRARWSLVPSQVGIM